MSIQTELSRIINAKAAIKAAIEGKGVTVPDATLLDGMAALIESIEAGGGLAVPSGFKIFSGDFILAEDTYQLDISSLLGFAPSVSKRWTFCTFNITDHTPYSVSQVHLLNVNYYSGSDGPVYNSQIRYRQKSGSTTLFYSALNVFTYSDGIIARLNSASYFFRASAPYYYVYFGEE